MSVLVKGMKMPTSCFVCPFCLNGYPDEWVLICSRLDRRVGNFGKKPKGIPKDCPLVEVTTPHGRLIIRTEEGTEEPAEPEDTKTEEPKKNSSGALIIVLILALGGAGGYLYFTKFKGKKPQKETVDPDADYTEEDDDYLDNLADEVDEIMAEDEETEESRLLKNEESDSDADDSGDEE